MSSPPSPTSPPYPPISPSHSLMSPSYSPTSPSDSSHISLGSSPSESPSTAYYKHFYDLLVILFALPAKTKNIFDYINEQNLGMNSRLLQKLLKEFRGVEIVEPTEPTEDPEITVAESTEPQGKKGKKRKYEIPECPITLMPIETPAYVCDGIENKIIPTRFEFSALNKYKKSIQSGDFLHPTTNKVLPIKHTHIKTFESEKRLFQRAKKQPEVLSFNAKTPQLLHLPCSIDRDLITHFYLNKFAKKNMYWQFIALASSNHITHLPEDVFENASDQILQYIHLAGFLDKPNFSIMDSFFERSKSNALLKNDRFSYCGLSLIIVLSDPEALLDQSLFISDLWHALHLISICEYYNESCEDCDFHSQDDLFFEPKIIFSRPQEITQLKTLFYCLMKENKTQYASNLILNVQIQNTYCPSFDYAVLCKFVKNKKSEDKTIWSKMDWAQKSVVYFNLLTIYASENYQQSRAFKVYLRDFLIQQFMILMEFDSIPVFTTYDQHLSPDYSSMWISDLIIITYPGKRFDQKPIGFSFSINLIFFPLSKLNPINDFTNKGFVLVSNDHWLTLKNDRSSIKLDQVRFYSKKDATGEKHLDFVCSAEQLYSLYDAKGECILKTFCVPSNFDQLKTINPHFLYLIDRLVDIVTNRMLRRKDNKIINDIKMGYNKKKIFYYIFKNEHYYYTYNNVSVCDTTDTLIEIKTIFEKFSSFLFAFDIHSEDTLKPYIKLNAKKPLTLTIKGLDLLNDFGEKPKTENVLEFSLKSLTIFDLYYDHFKRSNKNIDPESQISQTEKFQELSLSQQQTLIKLSTHFKHFEF